MANEIKAASMDSAYRSEHQKAGDRGGMTGGATVDANAKRDIGDRASDVADNIAHKAREVGDTLQDKASDVGHSMQETGQNIAEKTRHGHKAVCNFTKENPTAAVLIAFGLGAILARVIPGR